MNNKYHCGMKTDNEEAHSHPTEAFLLMNGFEKAKQNLFRNKLCYVEIFDDYYSVQDKSEGVMYSKDLNIYWLIGVLTYYNFIDKNYNSPIADAKGF